MRDMLLRKGIIMDSQDLDFRNKARDLYKAWYAAGERRDNYEPVPDSPELQAKLHALSAERHAAVAKISDAYDEAVEKAKLECGDPEMKHLSAAAEAAEAAYDAHTDRQMLIGWDEAEPDVCAKSGAPLFDDDETVEDSETREIFLRSELDLPPRVVESDEDLADVAE